MHVRVENPHEEAEAEGGADGEADHQNAHQRKENLKKKKTIGRSCHNLQNLNCLCIDVHIEITNDTICKEREEE